MKEGKKGERKKERKRVLIEREREERNTETINNGVSGMWGSRELSQDTFGMSQFQSILVHAYLHQAG